MNKNEQSQLCMLLAKMRYDIMEDMSYLIANGQDYEYKEELLNAINRILGYSYFDNNKRKEKNYV